MYTLYKLNADELDIRFLDSLKAQFQHKFIEISVCEAEQASEDETAYLMKSPANRDRLLAAIANVESGQNLVEVDPTDWQ
jgi:antitoxin YefM